MAPLSSPKDLVQLIVWLARERGELLTTIRLVKFLYLLDLFWAREHEGRTLTGWPWAFVHFGPFCREALVSIDDAVRSSLVVARPFRSKYTDDERNLYTSEDDRAPEVVLHALPDSVLGPLRDTIRRWADDTPALLDYVYFHTEPMADARPRERLDFTKAIKTEDPRPVQMQQLSGHQIRRAKDAARALAERYRKSIQAARQQEAAIYDDDFVNALRAMGDTEPPRAEPVKGTARIKP